MNKLKYILTMSSVWLYYFQKFPIPKTVFKAYNLLESSTWYELPKVIPPWNEQNAELLWNNHLHIFQILHLFFQPRRHLNKLDSEGRHACSTYAWRYTLVGLSLPNLVSAPIFIRQSNYVLTEK